MEALLARLSGLPHWQICLLATYFLFQGFLLTVFPEEVIITTLGMLWGQGKVGPFEALVCIWVGLLPANSATVYLGQRFGPKLLTMRPFSWVLKPEAIEQAMVDIRKFGKWIVFTTRFTPLIRGPVYFGAGFSQMGVFNFMKIDALASCIQVPALLLLGRYIGSGAQDLMSAYRRIGMAMGILLITTITLKIWSDVRKKRRRGALEIPSSG